MDERPLMAPVQTNGTVFRASRAVERIEATSLRPSFTPVPGLISLAAGEPDFDTPADIVDAAVTALRGGHTRYVDPLGDGELRDAIALSVTQTAGAPYRREQILVTHGSSAGLAAAIIAIVNPGDRVVIPEPTYSLYADLVELAGGTPVFVPLRADYHLDLDALAAALSGARLLVLCTPGNPTGVVLRADEWAAVAGLVTRSDAYVLADEAYYALVYDSVPFVSGLSYEALRDRLVYAQTFSKAYAMTGWRLGYLAGPPAVVRAAGVIHRAFNGTSNAFVQRAGLTALRDGTRQAQAWLPEYAERRRLALERLNAIDGLHAAAPEGGFYIFVRYDAPVASADLAKRMIAGGVMLRAGREYGPSGEGHFRISFATSVENLNAGIDRIEAVFAALPAPV
jgi:aspartate aminotransferase